MTKQELINGLEAWRQEANENSRYAAHEAYTDALALAQQLDEPSTETCEITTHKQYLIMCSKCGVIARYGKGCKDGDDALDLMKKAKYCPNCGRKIEG
jgi:ribosomal protein S27AE